METRTLKAGTVIKIEGIPLQLEQDVQASTAEGNWGLIEELKNIPQTGEGEEKGCCDNLITGGCTRE